MADFGLKANHVKRLISSCLHNLFLCFLNFDREQRLPPTAHHLGCVPEVLRRSITINLHVHTPVTIYFPSCTVCYTNAHCHTNLQVKLQVMYSDSNNKEGKGNIILMQYYIILTAALLSGRPVLRSNSFWLGP